MMQKLNTSRRWTAATFPRMLRCLFALEALGKRNKCSLFSDLKNTNFAFPEISPNPKLTLNCLYNPALTLSLPIYVKTNKWDDGHQGFCYLVLGISAHRCAFFDFLDNTLLIHLNSLRVIIKRGKSPRRPVKNKKKRNVCYNRPADLPVSVNHVHSHHGLCFDLCPPFLFMLCL